MTLEEAPVEWDLSELYAGVDDPQIARDFDALRTRASAFEGRYKGRFAEGGFSANDLAAALDEYDSILRQVARPAVFANLLFSADAKDEARGALMQKTHLETTSVN